MFRPVDTSGAPFVSVFAGGFSSSALHAGCECLISESLIMSQFHSQKTSSASARVSSQEVWLKGDPARGCSAASRVTRPNASTTQRSSPSSLTWPAGDSDTWRFSLCLWVFEDTTAVNVSKRTVEEP